MPDTENKVPFEVYSFQQIEQSKKVQNGIPYKYECFVVLWIMKGSGTQFIDFHEVPIQENTAYCFTPGQIHLLKTDQPLEGFLISFDADFLCLTEGNYDFLFNSGLFYSFSAPVSISVTPEMHTELLDLMQRIQAEYATHHLLRSEILRGYVKIFLIHLARQYRTIETVAAPVRNVELVRNFFSLLEKHLYTKKMVSDYAAELAVTPNYLNVLVKRATGIPAKDHIKKRVVLEAKRHAAYTDVNMKHIASVLGFEDEAHFSKYFKQAAGLNFTDFKRNASEQFN